MHINHFAVIAAALATFLIGGLWYSPLLFHRAWKDVNGLTDEQLRRGGMGKIFGLSFLFSWIMAYNLARSLRARIRRSYGERRQVPWLASAGSH